MMAGGIWTENTCLPPMRYLTPTRPADTCAFHGRPSSGSSRVAKSERKKSGGDGESSGRKSTDSCAEADLSIESRLNPHMKFDLISDSLGEVER